MTELKKSLGPWMIWGLGVGYVISGTYFGWNLGLPEGGPLGMLVATLFVTVMFVAFVLSYAELACALPKAGGAFVYTSRAFGPTFGFFGGAAQIVEFVFAPPAIAASIGAYLQVFFPAVPVLVFAIGAYFLFTALNIYGVEQSARFEMIITILAILGLLLFLGLAFPHVSTKAFFRDPLPKGWWGAWAALPFAIWFYLAIEGIANLAEESHDPQKNIRRGFIAAMITLVLLALLTFVAAVGLQGWRAVVYPPDSAVASDSPLPLALKFIPGLSTSTFHIVSAIGLCGLIASFHGILFAAGRATFEFGRVGYAPRWLGTTLPVRKTPAAALLVNMLVGIAALCTGYTGDIIVIAVFGALTLYVLSMLALFRLRRTEPELPRPSHAPLYPWLPGLALVLALFCLLALATFHPLKALLYLALLGAGYLAFLWFVPADIRSRSASS